jgi:hypothetical protein
MAALYLISLFLDRCGGCWVSVMYARILLWSMSGRKPLVQIFNDLCYEDLLRECLVSRD